MTKDEILSEMKLIAEENCVDLTENAEKIASFRAKSGLPLSVCPCSKDDRTRYCISKQCKKDIENLNTCHCRAFKKVI